jgi:hypothetical protein
MRVTLNEWFRINAGRITWRQNISQGLSKAKERVRALETQLAHARIVPPPDAAALLAWLAAHGPVVGPEHKASFLPAWIDAARELEALGVLAETERGLEFDAAKWASLLGE